MHLSDPVITSSLQHLKPALEAGGIIACPTEAVWGLSCDPFSEMAVKSLLTLKRREMAKGMIVVADTIDRLMPLLDQLESEKRDKVINSWPGPYTWILPDCDNLFPHWVKGNNVSVACRVSAHKPLTEVAALAGGFVVSTSANFAGEPPIRSLAEIKNHPILDSVQGVYDATLGTLSQPTQIRDGQTGAILR